MEQLTFNFYNLEKNRLISTSLAWEGIVKNFSSVTPSWTDANGFENFLKDMGERPEGAILVRVNQNKIFCKTNCRWINWREYALLNRKIPIGRFSHNRLIRCRVDWRVPASVSAEMTGVRVPPAKY